MYETRSPVDDRFSFSTKGTFCCAKPSERVTILIVVLSFAFIAVAWYKILFEQLMWYFVNDGTYVGTETARTIGYIYVFSLAFLLAVDIIVIRLVLHGNIYSYSADEKHFSFLSEKAHIRKTDIFYDDVVSVSYDEYYLFGTWLRGYIVYITTRSLGTLRLEYLFNKSIADKTTRNTPFYIIEERVAMITENASIYGR